MIIFLTSIGPQLYLRLKINFQYYYGYILNVTDKANVHLCSAQLSPRFYFSHKNNSFLGDHMTNS